MKVLKSVLCVLSIIILVVTFSLRHSYAQGKSHLKLYGKVLGKKKADISVFQEKNGDWSKIKSLKSRSKYNIELSPKENYYIVFISLDGMKNALYVNRGKTGDWIMRLNINFDAWSVKYATLQK